MNDDLHDAFETRLAAILELDQARALLAANPLEQRFVFEVADGENLSVLLAPHEESLTVERGPEDPEYEQYRSTRIALTDAQCRDLLAGRFLSELYLEEGVEITGLQPAWLFLGRLFGLNHDLLRDAGRR